MLRTRALDDSRGVILIALLWILTALSVLALSFSRESFVEVAVARNTRDLSDSYYIARAGMMATVYRLAQRRMIPQLRQLQMSSAPDPIDMGKVSGSFADGVYDVQVQDESGKINLNFVQEDQLRRLVEFVGIQKPDSDIIVDSILDWKEPNPEGHRINGAKDDYYQSLNPPYKAQKGVFGSVEDLLLVRGVTRDYFYGHPEKEEDGSIAYRYGLSRYFTVYQGMQQFGVGRVNANYAPLAVLMSTPGMTLEVAQAIIEHRQVKPFQNTEEISRELGLQAGAPALGLLSTDQTGTYTLTASGRREGSKVQRTIRAVVMITQNAAGPYRIVYWNENVPNL
jgi:general secretion pathway protein K